ncbi:capping protein-inhibiting regulator of actin dynamics-like isoform X1 [Penaeus indicus]|uniref:capping protein-inhibiting regulator of actin dynamics-like isoform X1 n=1 Tax=Penaeus indicus TaxID=29960 RepID=UPI00300D9AB3
MDLAARHPSAKQVLLAYRDDPEKQRKEMKKRYDSKVAEAATLQKENGELKKELQEKEKEIKLMQEQAKQAQLHQQRCESEAREHEAEKEGLNQQIAELQERSASLQVSCRLCDQIQTCSYTSLHARQYIKRCMCVYS